MDNIMVWIVSLSLVAVPLAILVIATTFANKKWFALLQQVMITVDDLKHATIIVGSFRWHSLQFRLAHFSGYLERTSRASVGSAKLNVKTRVVIELKGMGTNMTLNLMDKQRQTINRAKWKHSNTKKTSAAEKPTTRKELRSAITSSVATLELPYPLQIALDKNKLVVEVDVEPNELSMVVNLIAAAKSTLAIYLSYRKATQSKIRQ